MANALIAILAVLIGALFGIAYFATTLPTCEERGGRTVPSGFVMLPILINNTILMIPQQVYTCEGGN